MICINNSICSLGSILCGLAVTGVSFIFAPLILPQPFPLELEYPFPMYQSVRSIIYVHHIILIFQSVTQVGANTFPALLLWFVAARFNILSTRFRTISDMKQLLQCVYEHQALLRYMIYLWKKYNKWITVFFRV